MSDKFINEGFDKIDNYTDKTIFKDKYNLTKRENLFLAKKTMSTSIYHSARMENCNVTFPDTQTIIDGVSVGGLDMDDVNVIINLKRAWQYVFNNISGEFDLTYMKKIHGYVAYNEALTWGELRTGEVGINGVNYKPEIPIENEIISEMNEILNISNTTYRAIKFMLWAMRKQLFWDGNKRTSIISANKLLIEKGNGILVIREELLPVFNRRLSEFYETNDYSKIDKFIYNECIFGIDY